MGNHAKTKLFASDGVSRLGLGLENVFPSLGLEGFGTRLGIEGYRSPSQAYCLLTLNTATI